jgi:hypothetical protein
MVLIILPLVLFSQSSLLSCKDYDYLVGNLETSNIMSPSQQLDIKFALIEQTDPACFEIKKEDARAD